MTAALLLAALRDQELGGTALDAASASDLHMIADMVVAIEQFLARSPSALMLANLSDMLLEEAQINVPGRFRNIPTGATASGCLWARCWRTR